MSHRTFPKPPQRPSKRRKALRKVSERKAVYEAELDEITPALMARAGHLCEICRAAPVHHRHHRLRRGQRGKNTLDNLLALCDACHRMVHDRPALSYARGWMLRKNS